MKLSNISIYMFIFGWSEDQTGELAFPTIVIDSIDHYLGELYFEDWQKKNSHVYHEYCRGGFLAARYNFPHTAPNDFEGLKIYYMADNQIDNIFRSKHPTDELPVDIECSLYNDRHWDPKYGWTRPQIRSSSIIGKRAGLETGCLIPKNY